MDREIPSSDLGENLILRFGLEEECRAEGHDRTEDVFASGEIWDYRISVNLVEKDRSDTW